ncbi:uncharacterized protein LOC123672984 [Harmonia axyridis]|uniref:uncharacterized protein LOC123672984 n=1 Tax=Harmonia axyridis TaxID=115357 RepID=UPI001E275531|nr:uncharacterized protein LOC123672984 [Harmonia axyridis]
MSCAIYIDIFPLFLSSILTEIGMFVPIIFFFILLGFNNAQDLRLYYRNESSLLSVYNAETQIATIIDSDNDMSMLCDGNTGLQYLYSHRKNTVMKISRHESWVASKTSIQNYVQSIRSLKTIRIQESEQTQEFSIESAPGNVINEHYRIIRGFQSEMEEYGELKRAGSFSIFVNVLKELCRIKRSVLRNIIRAKLGAKIFLLRGGIMKLVSVFRGLSSLMSETSGTIETSITKETFDFEPLFQSECGTEALAIVASQINEHNSQAIEIVQYPTRMYKVVREFNGGLYTGLRGVEELLYHTVLFLKRRVSVEVYMDLLIQVTSQIRNIDNNLIYAKIQFIKRILTNKMPSSKLSVFLDAFSQDKLIVENVNICSIINQFRRETLSVGTIIHVLHSLRSGFPHLLSTLFVRLVFFTITGQGLFYVFRLIPSLKSIINFRSTEPIVHQIYREMKSVNMKNLMVNNVGSVPVIGNIFQVISQSLVEYKQVKQLWMRDLVAMGSLPVIMSWINSGSARGGQGPRGCIHEMGIWGIDRTNGCLLFN